jgi:hypothetical protein
VVRVRVRRFYARAGQARAVAFISLVLFEVRI